MFFVDLGLESIVDIGFVLCYGNGRGEFDLNFGRNVIVIDFVLVVVVVVVVIREAGIVLEIGVESDLGGGIEVFVRGVAFFL